ncbi:MAG: HNH endonuclease [Clostridia bacterium]|nr:HNH endonuclease [Clostridia bacterium]
MLYDFEKEIECTYKGETYSVRDNGTVMRHPRIGNRPRPTDNVWTFGKYNANTGYAEIAGELVHRIVATAFHGAAPSSQYVVDHIDTNRRNNRPENLRWVTKLENILLNPITAKKIILACGSIEEFLKDPSKLRQSYVDRDFEWMRAVSKEEAATSLERMLSWAKSDKVSSGGSLGEWIYRRGLPKNPVESVRTSIEIPNETLNTALKEIATTKQVAQELKPVRTSTNNPFNFPRTNESESNNAVVMYRTSGELFGLLKSQFESEKKLKLPDIILKTAGKGMVIKESWTEEFQESEYYYEGKARTPKSIILHCKDNPVALLIRMKSSADEKEISRLKDERFNIVEIDLSWAKNGVTDAEMKYLLQTDISKKKWIHHEEILKAKEKLLKICEPIGGSGQGVLHSYFACPLTSDSVEDIECWYCNYRIDSEIVVNGETCNCGCCFGKSGVQSYQDLLAVEDVEKEDDWIVGITYNKNGEIVTKKFDKEVQLQGKTLFQLWNERDSSEIIAHNIYSGWYVLIQEDPQMSFDKTGRVYGKLCRDIEELKASFNRSIFSFDSYCWEIVK